jgi:hypothetical protein
MDRVDPVSIGSARHVALRKDFDRNRKDPAVTPPANLSRSG